MLPKNGIYSYVLLPYTLRVQPVKNQQFSLKQFDKRPNPCQKRSMILLYKILHGDLWQTGATGKHLPVMPIDEMDGYVHLSTYFQLNDTLRLHFANKSDLIVLALDQTALEENLVWETARNDQQFPHVYGNIPISAVKKVFKASVSNAGEIEMNEVK